MAAPTYPFTAIVGAHDLSTALLLTALSPEIGGVLVRGEKGTAKSTMVRALAGVLPGQQVAEGCRFGCDPDRQDGCPDAPHDPARTTTRPARLVELPVGATEDRVVGSMDLRRALGEGDAAYQPGLLAEAHRGILYVDEVNLLHDHLVDVLLDAAAMGTNTVERDGISLSHPARITLVGTMNPEEGELRPQLLDRFGLTVEVRASREPQERTEVVRRRLAFDADPVAFQARYAEAEAELTTRLAQARGRLAEVELGDQALRAVARVCAGFDVDGMRADIVTARTAVAHAAWQGRDRVTREDIRAAALLALPHRRRRSPFDEPGLDEDLLDALLDEEMPEGPDDRDDRDDPDGQGPDDDGSPGTDDPGSGADRDSSTDQPAPDDQPENGAGPQSSAAHQPRPEEGPDGAEGPEAGDRDGDRGSDGFPAPVGVATTGTPYRARRLTARGLGSGPVGRRSPALTTRGRTVGVHAPGREPHSAQVHLAATVRAGAVRRAGAMARPDAPHRTDAPARTDAAAGARSLSGRDRRWSGDDLRYAVTRGQEANLVLLVVDASGSMAARRRMEEVKTAVLSLLMDAYQRRDRVGLISFRGAGAELVLPPTWSVEAAAARLQQLGHGGRTPLAEGLVEAHRTVARERIRDRDQRALVVLVTDGRATAGKGALARAQEIADRWAGAHTDSVVVDCESGRMRLGLARDLARRMGAEHIPLEQVAAGSLVDIVTTRSGKAA